MVALTGTVLGRYEILGVIGRGTMGAVYKARDPKIDRLVALKTIAIVGQAPEEDEEYRERFFQEARAAGRLAHPGIVTIFDVGEEPGTRDPYIVMEYIEGRQLDELCPHSGKKLSPVLVLKLIEEIAEALDYAHRQGVIHRDIKPANILITDQGKPKITDFGIAKLNQSNLTTPGTWLGSPAYMAPEQLAGEEVDGRADIFSLGVILYTMLTGHRPFQGTSTATVIYRVVHHQPLPVSALQPEIPQEVDQVVLQAIAKDRSERYQNGAEMAAALHRLRDNPNLDGKYFKDLVSESPAPLSGDETRKRPNFIKQQTERIRTMVQAAEPASESSSSKQRKKLLRGTAAFATALLLVAGILWHHRQYSVSLPATLPNKIATSDRNKDLLQSSPADVAKSTLTIEIAHHFELAEASFWLDGDLVYSSSLKGEKKPRVLLLRQMKGFVSHNFRIVPGKHEMKVRVRSLSNSYDQTRTIVGDCLANKKNILQITADRHTLQMKLR